MYEVESLQINNIRNYKFGYRSDTSTRTFTFTYDFSKDVYHEKVESSYIKEEGNLKPYVQNLSFIMSFDLATTCNNTYNASLISKSVMEYKSNPYLKSYNKYINLEKVIFTALKLESKEVKLNEVYQLCSNVIYAMYSKDMFVLSSKEKYINIYTRVCYMLNYLCREVYINNNEYNVYKNLNKEIILETVLKLSILFNNKKDTLIDLIKNLERYEYNNLKILNSIILEYKDKITSIHIDSPDVNLSIIDSTIIIELINYIFEPIAKKINILSGLNLSTGDNEIKHNPFSLLLELNSHLVSKLFEKFLIKEKRVNDAFIQYISSIYLRQIKQIGFSNKSTEYVKPIYDINNDLNELDLDKCNLKDILLHCLKNELEKWNNNIDINTEEKRIYKNTVYSIFIEPVIKLTIKKLLIDIKYIDIENINLTKSIRRDITNNENYIQVIKTLFKDLNIQSELDTLLENSINSKESFSVLIERIEILLNKLDKNTLISSKYFLEKYEDIIKIIIENIEDLSKNTEETYIEESIFLNENNKGAFYQKDTLAFIDMKLINIEEEKQLKLWKRFWFLYASDEVDRKILPYNDFPYDSQPIEFENKDNLYPENWNVTNPHEFWKKIDYHPIPEGASEALDEIDLSINIMIEIINILILMWGKHYSAFWGWTGTQAVLGITGNVYEWLRLETSLNIQSEKNVKEHYDRCFRWLRWEAEKVSLMARDDMELRGNYYVGILIEEMINYMLDHHFNVMPLFEDINKMDEWRRSFERDLQGDIPFVLDKVKGIRHKIIEGKERKING